MKSPIGLAGLTLVLASLSLGVMAGCSGNARAVEEAYQQGLLDGVASVQEELVAAETAYDQGYADGLAAAQQRQDAELCQRCYGLGFADGYQTGRAEG